MIGMKSVYLYEIQIVDTLAQLQFGQVALKLNANKVRSLRKGNLEGLPFPQYDQVLRM